MLHFIVCGILAVAASLPAVLGQGIFFDDFSSEGQLPQPFQSVDSEPFQDVIFTDKGRFPEVEEIPSDVEGSEVFLLRGGGQFDCRAPDGQRGRCGVFQQCKTLTKVLLPLSSANIAYLRRSVCKNDGKRGRLLICCPPKSPQSLRPTTLAPLIFVDNRRTTRRPVTLPSTQAPTTASTTESLPSTPEQISIVVEATPSSLPPGTTPAVEVSESSSSVSDVAATNNAAGTSSPSPTPTQPATENVQETVPTTPPSGEDTPGTSSTSAETSPTTSASSETSLSSASEPPVSTPTEEPVEVTDEAEFISAEGFEGGDAEGSGEELEAADEPVILQELPGLDVCGYRNVSAERIIGGRIAEPNAWPWLAALGYDLEGDGEISYLCGGALITDRHVLTAAHCLKPELKTVRLGDHDLFNETEVDTVTEHAVLKLFPHEQYSNRTFVNDIGIIKLQTPVPFSDAVHPICVPLAPEMRSIDLVRKTTFIAGWGTVEFRGEASDILKEATVQVQRQQLCRVRYRALRHKIVDTQMCAASRGNDACQGDSGGPMMFPGLETDHWYTVGVVSFGFKCGEPRFPGVYTKVTSYVDWIVNHLR